MRKNKIIFFFIISILLLFISQIALIASFFLPEKTLGYLRDSQNKLFYIFITLEIVAVAMQFIFYWSANFFKNLWIKEKILVIQKNSFEAFFKKPKINDVFDKKNDFFQFYTKDLEVYKKLYLNSIFYIIQYFIQILLSIAITIFINIWIGLIFLMFIILGLMLSFILNKKNKDLSIIFEKNIQNYNHALIESKNVYATFFFYNKWQVFKSQNDKLSKSFEEQNNLISFRQNKINAFLKIMNNIFCSAILLVSGLFILNKVISFNWLITISLIAISSFYSFNSFFGIFMNLEKSTEIVKKIKSLKLEKGFFNKVLQIEKISIKEQNVNFINGKITIPKINFEKNKKYLISGPSGSGKSTIVKILLGFQKSDIKFNDRIRKNISFHDVVNNFAFIEKNSSIMENSNWINNISLFDKKPDKSKIKEILKMVNLKVDDLKEKIYNSSISSGMKQKIAIAQAIYHNKKFIILDEALSSIDLKSRELILDYLLSQKDLTILYIDHYIKNEYLDKFDLVINLEKTNV